MTKQDHLDLYEEIKDVLYKRNSAALDLTPAQRMFILAFEGACFDDNFLQAYAQMVDNTPAVELRDLHAFCLGFGIGKNLGNEIDNDSLTTH